MFMFGQVLAQKLRDPVWLAENGRSTEAIAAAIRELPTDTPLNGDLRELMLDYMVRGNGTSGIERWRVRCVPGKQVPADLADLVAKTVIEEAALPTAFAAVEQGEWKAPRSLRAAAERVARAHPRLEMDAERIRQLTRRVYQQQVRAYAEEHGISLKKAADQYPLVIQVGPHDAG